MKGKKIITVLEEQDEFPHKPDEVSNVIEFLISEKSSYITGSTIYVDGGWNVS